MLHHSICITLLGLSQKKQYRLGGFNKINLLSHHSRGQMFEIKLSVGLVSLKRYLLGFQMAPFLLYSHISFLLCVCFPGISAFKSPQSYAIRVHPMGSCYLFLIEVQLNYNIVLVLGVQQSDSVICVVYVYNELLYSHKTIK